MQDLGQQSTMRTPHDFLPYAKQQQIPVQMLTRSPYYFQPYLWQQRPVPSPYSYHFQPYLVSKYVVHFQPYLRRKHRSGQQFLPFEEALLFARALKLKTQKEWYAWCKSGARPATLPAHPEISYDREGWQGYGHWLGSGPVGLFNQQRPYQQRCHCPGEHYHQYPQQGGHPSYATPSPHPGNRMMLQPAPSNDAHALEPVRVPSETSSCATIVPLADYPTTVGTGVPVAVSSGPQKPDGNGHTLAADLVRTHIVSRRHGGSSLGLVSNPTPPHMVSSTDSTRTARGWKPCVYTISAKQRNFLVKEMKLSREQINSLKVECRKRKQRKAQSK